MDLWKIMGKSWEHVDNHGKSLIYLRPKYPKHQIVNTIEVLAFGYPWTDNFFHLFARTLPTFKVHMFEPAPFPKRL